MADPPIQTESSSRFVILHHLAPTGEHWDLMLEQGTHLATWRIASQPIGSTTSPIECTRISHHRKRYLNFEGPLSGGRGVVTRVDQGWFQLLAADDDEWTLDFAGRHLTGPHRLTRVAGDAREAWLLTAD